MFNNNMNANDMIAHLLDTNSEFDANKVALLT